MTKANLVELNQDPLHQRHAISAQNRKIHVRKRNDPAALTRRESGLREALRRMDIRPIEYEHELPTDPPIWIDALVRIDGQLWFLDCSPYFRGIRTPNKRERRVLRCKQLYAQKHDIPLVLLTGSVLEMIGTLEIERFRRKVRET